MKLFSNSILYFCGTQDKCQEQLEKETGKKVDFDCAVKEVYLQEMAAAIEDVSDVS